MKAFKKSLSIILAVIMLTSCLCVFSFAESDSVTSKFLCYNVAGLPNINYYLGKGGANVSDNQTQLGKILDKTDYDVIAVQEDFSFHSNLVAGLNSYTYKTPTSGGIPGGDGLNVYTKNSKIYDAKRTAWNVCGGPIADGDCLTPKGILYTVLDLGNGVLVDFYDLHADAFDGDENALARVDQYNQLLDLVERNSADRPVIITGDFNTSLHIKNTGDNAADEVAMKEVFLEKGGFKDAWIELCNNGDYDDFSSWNSTGVHYWGHWDSVEKYYYRNGGGIEIQPSDFEYVNFYNSDNENISDHSAASCVFTFTKTADFQSDIRSHSVKRLSSSTVRSNQLKWLLKDLILVLKNWKEVKELLGI